jgi:predicted RNase H-like HicB family nuclease
MRSSYTARAVRRGRWWAIEVPEIPGVFSQALRIDLIEPMAREAIALMLEVPEDSFDVAVEPDLTSLGDLKILIEDARRQRESARIAQQQATQTLRLAVSEIRSRGYTTRDAGALLGLSVQRISQLERSVS